MTKNNDEIVLFAPGHQPGIDELLLSITEEYDENFFSPTSKKISELSLLPDRQYWVAIIGGNVVGTIGMLLHATDTAVLKSMFLHRSFRGREWGLALKLLKTATQWASQNKCTSIYLGTMAQFKAAQRFYEKNGFVRIEEQELPAGFPANTVDTVFYRKTIS